ncbi:hypothetical protein Aperf_G00000065043 [Anoplocephala perfoliata]
MAGCSGGSSDDEPVSVSFKQLKKDKFVLTTSLKESYVKAQRDAKSRNTFRDPRFDPRKLKKDLAKVKSAEQRKKIISAIKILKQRQATEKDIEIRRRVKLNLQKEQMKNLKAGKRVSFLTRNELKGRVREERLKSLSQRKKERYLSRQSRKKYQSSAFDD